MASVYNRGTRDLPNWYAQLKHLDGKWRFHRLPETVKTKPEARSAMATAQERVKQGLPPFATAEARAGETCKALMGKWLGGISNRNAQDDRTRAHRSIVPKFSDMKPSEITLPVVLDWIDEMSRSGLASGTQRSYLNLLSRWMSWCVARGHLPVNIVRQIPTGERPQQAAKTDVPYLDDDSLVRHIFHALPSPVRLFFYLGNRTGMRLGEIAGLRMADLRFLDERAIRVRFTYDGAPLKEDKRGTGKCKWVPAPADASAVFGPLIAEREAEEAQPEDLLFVARHGKAHAKTF
jgi:integrase